MDTNRLGTMPEPKLSKESEHNLAFKPITLDSLSEIEPFLHRQCYRTCDFSIGGIYMWVDYFGYEYCISQDTLFIKGGEEDNLQNTAFAVPEPAALEIQQLYGCPITELPDWGDYLYNAVDLATLVGHRFNKKRNRVNKFKSTYPDYRYEMITSQNLPEITAFFETYKQEYQKDSLLFTYEESKVVQVLHEYEKLKFEGGALRVSGQIVAFSIGEVIGDTLIVHIEKVRKEVAGVYEAINQFYSAQMAEKHPEVKYINREDDAGDAGLREAKLSYNPETILKKYNIALNEYTL